MNFKLSKVTILPGEKMKFRVIVSVFHPIQEKFRNTDAMGKFPMFL